MSALVDTGSPVTIVSLECIVKTLAKKRQAEQSPTQWRSEIEERLEPPTLPLQSYGGSELNLVKQIRVTLSRAGFSVTSVVQVHSGAPVDLLLGTDLLPQLGFSMVAQGPDGSALDLLQEQPPGVVSGSPTQERDAAVVRLIQATKLPPLYQKMVCARVHTPGKEKRLMLFEPEQAFTDRSGVRVAEAAVELSDEQEVTDPAELSKRSRGTDQRSHSQSCLEGRGSYEWWWS